MMNIGKVILNKHQFQMLDVYTSIYQLIVYGIRRKSLF